LRDSSLIAKKIVCIEMGFYASPEYIDQKGVPVTIRDFEHHEIISFINDESGLMVTKNGKSHVVQPNTRIKVNDILACREAAKSGLGVAVLPSLVVHNELQKSRLQEILSDYELPKATLYAVYPSRKWMPSKTKVFLDYLDGKKLLK